jgi:predicted GIY-YIG superfamily endonuclease
MKTGPIRNAQQTKKYVYSIPCECGRCYIGETSRPLEVRIKEHI